MLFSNERNALFDCVQHAAELALGLKVSGELGLLGFSSPVTLLVCSANEGALAVAGELKAEATRGKSAGSVSVAAAEAKLDPDWAPSAR